MTAAHLIALDRGWSLWRWVSLRATGFPARLVLELGSDELAAAADRHVELHAEAERRRAAFVAACEAVLERAPSGGDAHGSAQRALARLRRQGAPTNEIADPEAEAARQELLAATVRLEAAARAAEDAYQTASMAASMALRGFAADDRFCQAVLWQNPSAMRTSLAVLLRTAGHSTDSKTRGKARMVASYLQRYCVKNDTIGFFGPVGWMHLVDEPVAIVQRPGASLLETRTAYFEYWAIDALATKLARDPALRAFAAPRMLPKFRLEGATLHYPIGKSTTLSDELAAVAARCNGISSARQIAREVIADGVVDLADEAAVFAVLDELAEAGVVTWTFEVPTAAARPELHLARMLQRIEDPALRVRAEAVLGDLDRARSRVLASQDAKGLETTLGELLDVFHATTDEAGAREHGKTYAARTPLYMDCRRNFDGDLGRDILDRVGAPLALVLQSARWYTHELASRYRAAFASIYQELRAAEGTPQIDFAHFWHAGRALFAEDGSGGQIVTDVRSELQRRWAEILEIDAGGAHDRVVMRRASDIADRVERAFAAPCPGWPAARHHSPDLLVAGQHVVLGELHTGMNTVCSPLFVKEHPHPEELIAARDADLDRVGIAPVWTKAITRADYYSLSPRDLDLEVGDRRSARARTQVLSPAQLVVEERDGALEVCSRDGKSRFDIIAFNEHHLIAESYARFSPIASAPRTPRIAIDDLVIGRATWRMATADIAWPKLDQPAARFLGARRWAHELGLPRHVFVRTSREVKPVYIDFASTIYVEMLAKQLRESPDASLSEMLPTIEDAWVLDREGNRYSGELRIAAVDPERWRPERV